MPHPDLDLNIPPLVTARGRQAAPDFAVGPAAPGAGPEQTNALEAGCIDPALAVRENTQAPPPDLAGEDRRAERELLGLAVTMLRFVQHNPGCAQTVPRERYTDGFRRFTRELRRCYADVPTAVFAAAVDLPLDLVEDWLRGGRRRVDPSPRTRRATRGARTRLA